MLRRKKFEYKFVQAQAFWDPDTNTAGFDPDLMALGMDGWRLIKIIPREKDYFDLFFERAKIQINKADQ